MKKKRITVNINTTYKYLRLWNGLFNLTPKELKILAALVDVNREQSLPVKNACNIEIKKLVAERVGIKDYNTLNNYVKRFKDKGVILKKSGNYALNKLLDPETSSVEILINYAH
jgi:hypothetical protein|tara:strand:- start:2911 stop:3252 length:342 start_codon:yes stop_codon:yes gene_type:complete